MSKIEVPKSWDNVEYKTLRYKKQTQMKHQILSKYLKALTAIRGMYYSGIFYIDGFGGIGAYHTEHDLKEKEYLSRFFGSPVFSLAAIRFQQQQGKLLNSHAIIIDKRKKNLANIELVLKKEKIDMKKVQFIHGDFDVSVNKFLDNYKGQLPSFFLIDPFGFSVKLQTIKRIMDLPKSEVVINFMYDAIQHWKSGSGVERVCNDLFGSNKWKDTGGMTPNQKESFLVSLYRDVCINIAGAQHVWQFPISYPNKKRTFYYLFHLCKDPLGTKIMKHVVAGENEGELTYQGERKSPSLPIPVYERGSCGMCFCKHKNGSGLCTSCFLQEFKGQTLTFKEIWGQIIDKIPLTAEQIGDTLKKLERDGKISVMTHPPRKRNIKKGRTVI